MFSRASLSKFANLQWLLLLFKAFACIPDTGDGCTICRGVLCVIDGPSPMFSGAESAD
jgi:hypothetical protein